jgi:hypothetical protein
MLILYSFDCTNSQEELVKHRYRLWLEMVADYQGLDRWNEANQDMGEAE